MSKLTRTAACLLFLVTIALAREHVPGEKIVGVPGANPFFTTRSLLKCFYPEVFADNRFINFSTAQPVDNENWDEFFGFEFRVVRFAPNTSWNPTFDPQAGKMRPTPENTVFLNGSTWIGSQGEILRFEVEGELAHSRENERIRRLVESHPDWSEEQAIRALKDAGALFGPAEEKQLMDSLNFQLAENYLGRIKIKLVEFEGLSPNHEGNFARLYWIVQAQGEYSDGHHRTYGVSFEPFGGKLTGLRDIPDRKYEDDQQ